MENVAARNKERWHSAQMPRFSQGIAVSKEGHSTPLFSFNPDLIHIYPMHVYVVCEVLLDVY